MDIDVQRMHDLNSLREFVHETFCQQYQLKHGAFELTERLLVRNGRPCGMYYCLHGPRAVKFCAIWDVEGRQVLFYGSSGERFRRTRLADAPVLDRRLPPRAGASCRVS